MLNIPLDTADPELGADYHPLKNSLPVSKIYPNTRKTCWWLCRTCGFEWKDSPFRRSNVDSAMKCPQCYFTEHSSRIGVALSCLGRLNGGWTAILKCHQGHVVKTSYTNISKIMKCKLCKAPQKKQLSAFISLKAEVEQRGWTLLNTEFVPDIAYTILCERGHRLLMRRKAIKSGVKCIKCRRGEA